jgi:hypothetical protein
MTRAIRPLLLTFGARFFLGIVRLTALIWITHLREGTYYGAYSDILPVGTRVVVAQDFASVGSRPIGKTTSGVVQGDPAWDEDSCDPDRLINVRLSSGEVVSLPRHILHR